MVGARTLHPGNGVPSDLRSSRWRVITNVYIDGFNLYYGCLKRSPYKWLDFVPACAAGLG